MLDLLYELVGLPQPVWTDEYSVAIAALDPTDFQVKNINNSLRLIFTHVTSMPYLNQCKCIICIIFHCNMKIYQKYKFNHT